MDFVRIGDKIISRNKVINVVDKIFALRSRGWSQQEIANELGTDRSFVSRLETLAEVRRGKRIALVGFPIANKDEIEQIAKNEGVEFTLLLTEKERWGFVQEKSGLEVFDEIMRILSEIRGFDVVIIMASNKRVALVEGLLDKEVIRVEIGHSPLGSDVHVDPDKIIEIIRTVKK